MVAAASFALASSLRPRAAAAFCLLPLTACVRVNLLVVCVVHWQDVLYQRLRLEVPRWSVAGARVLLLALG